MSVRGLGACVVAASLAAGAPVAAQPLPSGLALQWSAPPQCPTAAQVSDAVARLLGRPLAEGPSPCVARARVQPLRRRGWRLRLSIATRGAPRHRTLEGASCVAVTDAAALVLALAIDPEAVASRPAAPAPPEAPQPPPAPAPPPQPPPPLPPPVAVARPEPAPPRPSRPLRWHLRAAVFGDVGSLPAATVGPSLAVGLSYGALRVEAYAVYAAPQRAALDRGGGDFDLVGAGLSGCGLARVGRFDLGGCGGLEAGSLRGAAYGVARPGSGSAPWLAVTFGAAARARLSSRWGVLAQVGGAAPLRRPEFVIDEVGAVFRASALTLRATAGVEVYF